MWTVTKQEFIQTVAGYVKKYAADYGVMVHSPIIAQTILESRWGESVLAALYHNYHGLKCGTKWTGPSVNLSTNEEYSLGVLTEIKDNFRVYGSMEEGIKGYFDFIQLPRYENLKGITDPQTYLETIKADGYATSSAYVQNNMNLIEQYQLTKYDRKDDVTVARLRSKVVALAQSWIGKNEADGSYKEIIDIYNSMTSFPRGTKMLYSWPWCACMWSALAVKLGYTDIMPVEISCSQLITLAQNMGIWQENDGYIPKSADAVLYDWDDSGMGDNTGNPDHIGVVETVNETAGTFIVIEGNYSNCVKRRTMEINGKYIRGFICPKYDQDPVVAIPEFPTSAWIDEAAQEVIAGKWGNGTDRKENIYNAIQNRVNELSPTGNTLKSVDEVAREVIAGQWGNGQDRIDRLTAAGYDYDTVQARVNTLKK